MSHKAIKIGLTAAVLIAAFSALLFTTLQDNLQYCRSTSMRSPPRRMNGREDPPGSRLRRPWIYWGGGLLDYRFDLQRNGKVMTVLQGRCPGHVQGRCGGRLTGQFRRTETGSRPRT